MSAPAPGVKFGKWMAILLILAAVIVAVWLIGPLSALIGLFVIPASSTKAKELEANEKEQILAEPAAVVVSQQSATLQSGIKSIQSDALAELVADSSANTSTGIPDPQHVAVTISDPRGN